MNNLYKRAFMALAAVAALSTLPASADDLTVNEGTQTGTYSPIYGYNFDNAGRTQIIYAAPGLAAMENGTITSVTFHFANVSKTSTPNPSVQFYMGSIENTMFTSTEWVSNEGMAKVFDGELGFTKSDDPGTLTIQLTTPYVYNGGNLLLEIDNGAQQGGWATVNWLGIASNPTTESPSLYTSYGNSANFARFYPMTTFTYDASTVNGVKDVIDSNLSGDYTVVDLSGKVVARGNGNVQDAQRGLNPGMYIVRIGGKASKVIVR